MGGASSSQRAGHSNRRNRRNNTIHMHSDYESQLGKEVEALEALPPRIVQSLDGTTRENPYLTRTAPESAPSSHNPDIDALFGQSPAYQSYKREKFEHRLMLWYRLQGHSVKETAALTGYTPQSVSQISKQPWFTEAFIKLAKENGKDAIQTMIEGAVIPAFQRLEELAATSKMDSVRLAANKELLDRYLGKTVAKTETKISGSIDQNIYDAAKLMQENALVQKELAARGIGQHLTN
jgi:hypothetical protein